MDFQSTLNPNEINPGASFSSAFQSGLGAAVQLHGQQLQKQIAMSQLGEQGREFDLMQQLRQKELGLNQQRTMADIASINAGTELEKTQIGQQQFALQQLPKMAANRAAIAQWQASPEAQDPSSFESSMMKLRAALPHPDAMGDQEWQQTANSLEQQQLKTTASLNFQAAHNKNLQILADAPTLFGDQGTKAFMVNPNGDPTDPKNYNMAALAQASEQKQIQMSRAGQEFATQQKIAESVAVGDEWVKRMQVTAASRELTAQERSMTQMYTDASNRVKADPSDKQAAADLENAKQAILQYNQIHPAVSVGQPAGGSMQNPSGTPTQAPAQSFIQQFQGK